MSYLKFVKSRLLILLSLSLILITSIIFSFNKRTQIIYKTKAKESFEVSNLPILKSTDNVPVLSAQSVYAIDLDSAVVLYEKNPDLKLFPASTTKMVTALVAMEVYSLDQVVNTGTFSVVGQKMGLVWNENITIENLLYGLLVHSANDAAEVLANVYPSGREEFLNKMNLKAKEVHAINTQFKNPSGLDENGHYSSARDLARIATSAMKNDTFAQIVATEERVATSTDGQINHYLSNRNELLGEVEGVLGVKTGWTENARENLVTFVERDGKKVIIALMGSQDRFGETEELVEWIFTSYDWQIVNSQEPLPAENRNIHL